MELSIIRRETTGASKVLIFYSLLYNSCLCYIVPNVYNESETITKFEIMDGAPVRGKTDSWLLLVVTDLFTLGETIPIRLFLGGFELTPTFRGKLQFLEYWLV